MTALVCVGNFNPEEMGKGMRESCCQSENSESVCTVASACSDSLDKEVAIFYRSFQTFCC